MPTHSTRIRSFGAVCGSISVIKQMQVCRNGRSLTAHNPSSCFAWRRAIHGIDPSFLLFTFTETISPTCEGDAAGISLSSPGLTKRHVRCDTLVKSSLHSRARIVGRSLQEEASLPNGTDFANIQKSETSLAGAWLCSHSLAPRGGSNRGCVLSVDCRVHTFSIGSLRI